MAPRSPEIPDPTAFLPLHPPCPSTPRASFSQALALVLAGAGLGIVGALVATRYSSRLLFGVEPTDPLTYGVAFTASVAVGAVAAWISARRAAGVDPVVALRVD